MLPLFILAIENDDDRQFVADIYTRYQPALYRKAQKVLHDNDRAEEAVHEAMLRVIRYLDRVREIPSDELLPYLISLLWHPVLFAFAVLPHSLFRRRYRPSGGPPP